MEVKLDKRYPVAASPEQAWAVLSNIHATASCMPGAQITEQVDATHFKGTVKSKVGPAVMSFGGDIEVRALDAASKSMQMMAKGADRSGSSASMNLAAHIEAGVGPGSCVLAGLATIIVSGKLAQFGSRLLVPVSDAMLAQFADNFRIAAQAVPAPAASPMKTSAAESSFANEATTTLMIQAGQMPGEHVPVRAAPVKELNALALMWTVIKGWIAGLFGSKRA